jgi:hypothetical protein
MKQYLLRYFLVAFAAILLVAGSTRVFARAGGTTGLAGIFQASSDDSSTETVEPTETAGSTETAEPSETPEVGDDDDQGEDQDNQGEDQDDQGEDDDENEADFTGTVEPMSADSWVISGVTVLISSETEIEGDIAVGDVVKVEGTLNPDGSITAREIEGDDDSIDSDDSGSGSDDGNSGSDHGDDDDDNSGPGNGDDDNSGHEGGDD